MIGTTPSDAPLRDETVVQVPLLQPEEQAALDRVNDWLAKGAHLSKTQTKSTNLLLDASRVGHTEAVRVLLEKGVRVLIEQQGGACSEK